MKKTLLLMALLGSMAATTQAEVVWMDGLNETTAQNYTYTKYVYTDHPDGYNDDSMCFAISACNTLAWWQDRVEQNGALIIPKDAPRGEDIWAKIRKEWVNRSDGGQPNVVMQYYLTGYTYWSESTLQSRLTQAGRDFIETKGGYYKHLTGAYYNWYNTALYPEYTMIKYVDARGYNSSTAEYPNGFTSYEGASKYLVQLLKEGYGGVLKTVAKGNGPHAMSFYGVETNEEGAITKIWYDDNNVDDHVLSTATVCAGGPNQTNPENATMDAYVGYGNGISSFTMLRTKGILFDTYTLTMTGQESDEDLFSHYLNLVVDGASDYKLQYDLRDAHEKDSPVTPTLITLNEKREVISTEEVTTGDISLKSGKLSLIACDAGRETLDGGGKISGTITYDEKSGATRTLSVQHTATIAKEIKIAAETGNTLEVTEGNTASFGKLTGEGNLLKTGAGTAAVTEALELKGTVDVQDGRFQLGAEATLSGETILLVGKEGSVENMSGTEAALVIESGEHTNDGTLSLATTVTGGTLKGSGTFAAVTVDGGTLMVGNSPGHQTYTDSLTLNSGKIVFCAAGLETASEGDNTGWASEAYSTINMDGQDLLINENGEIVVSLGGALLEELADLTGDFTLTLATEVGNTDAFDEAALLRLANQTTFNATDELAANGAIDPASHIGNVAYALQGSSLVLTGTLNGGNVPEPATGTLGLLALVALASRRRRK